MSVEGGPSGVVAAVSTGLAVGPGVSLGPAISGGMEASLTHQFGPNIASLKTGPLFSTIVKEGPVAPVMLEKTVPLSLEKFPTQGEIRFQQPLVITQAEEVAAKAWAASEPAASTAVALPSVVEEAKRATVRAWEAPEPEPLSEAAVIREAEYWLGASSADRIQAAKVLEAATQAGIKPEVAKKWVANALPGTQPQIKTEVSQQVSAEPQVTGKMETQREVGAQEEEKKELKRKYVLDERTLDQRIMEIKAAVVRAKEEASKLGAKVTGKMVAWFLSAEHSGNRSEVVKNKGPDGSLTETQEAIRSLKEFAESIEAQVAAIEIAKDRPPVKIRPEGEPVSQEDVERIYRKH